MKINKSVEAYVSKLVHDKANEKLEELRKERDALVAKYEDNDKKYDEALEELLADTKVKIEALMAKHKVVLNDQWRTPSVSVYAYDSAHTKRPESIEQKRLAIEKEMLKIENIANEKTTEIIAKLTLGGTTEDLEKMVAAVNF